jgi:hypothetical protein
MPPNPNQLTVELWSKATELQESELKEQVTRGLHFIRGLRDKGILLTGKCKTPTNTDGGAGAPADSTHSSSTSSSTGSTPPDAAAAAVVAGDASSEDASLQEIISKVNLESNLTRLGQEYDMHLQKHTTRAWMAPPLDERGVLRSGCSNVMGTPVKRQSGYTPKSTSMKVRNLFPTAATHTTDAQPKSPIKAAISKSPKMPPKPSPKLGSMGSQSFMSRQLQNVMSSPIRTSMSPPLHPKNSPRLPSKDNFSLDGGQVPNLLTENSLLTEYLLLKIPCRLNFSY